MTPPINITTSPNVGQISPQQGTEAINSSDDLPPELEKPKSSFWKTLGRIGLGIVTGSLSELIPLAWKGIQWICSKISGGSERQAQVPANQDPLPQTNPAADKINSSVIAGLKDNAKMPAAFSAAANEALAELRQTYGEGCVPKDATLSSLTRMLSTKLANAGSDAGKGLFLTVKNAEEPLTPEGFKSMIKQNFAQDLNRLTLLDTVSQSLADKPLLSAASPIDILINVLKDPALQGISSAASPEQVNSLAEQCKLESFLTKLEQDMQQTLDQLRETYGEAVPQSTQELMNLTIENGQKLSKQISDHFTHCTQPVTVENANITRYFKETAGAILQNRGAILQVQAECKALGTELPAVTVQAIATDALQQAGASKPTSQAVRELIQAHTSGLEAAKEKYLPQVHEQFKPLLARFISNLSHSPVSAKTSDAKIAHMIETMKNWRPIGEGDPEIKPLNDVFKKSYEDYYSKLADAPGQAKKFNEDSIFETMLRDSLGVNFNIGGEIHKPGKSDAANKQHITQIMKEKVPDDVDRQFVSKLMNQSIFGEFTTMMQSGILPDGQMISAYPCGKLLCHAKNEGSPCAQQRGSMSLSITFSEDGQTARITATSVSNLQHTDGTRLNGRFITYGTTTANLVVDIRLGAHPQGRGIENLQIKQDFAPLPNGE